MEESKTFDDNEKAFNFACDLWQFMDHSVNTRTAIIKQSELNKVKDRTVFQLQVEDKKPITGFSYSDVSANDILREGDLVGVKIIKIEKHKLGFFRKHKVAICIMASLLEPSFDFSRGWKVKEYISTY